MIGYSFGKTGRMSTAIATYSASPAPAMQVDGDGELYAHMQSLGLISVSAYKLWCRRHGLSMDLHKSAAERTDELELFRHQSRPVDRTGLIEAIAAGDYADRWLAEPMSRVPGLFAEVATVDGGHEALLRLLLHVEKHGRLLLCVRGSRRLPRTGRNLVIMGLSQLARHHHYWVRPLEDWRPTRGKPQAQFEDLACHLLARYPVPDCLHAGWFEEAPQEADIQQGWFLHVGSGNNIRTASDLPFRLTKRAAHLFTTSEHWDRPLVVLRHAQVRAIDEQVHRLFAWGLCLHERIYSRRNANFWTSILHFFLNNPMLDRSYIGAIIDYVHYTKFEPRRIPLPDGSVQTAPPAHPKFCLKGRSIDRLVREVDDWHAQLSGGEFSHVEEWAPSGMSGFDLTEDNDKLRARIQWTIQELCTSALLQVEGRMLHHCVGSYTRRCIDGEVSIWSLRSRVDQEEADQHHVLTIAVDNRKRQVTQARGKFNLQPHGSKLSNKQRRTDSNYRVALRESARILALWRTQEGLSYSEG